MAKPKRIRRAIAAETIRASLLHGAADGALWGIPQDDGNDQPNWQENRWRFSMGSSLWAEEAYQAGYRRAYRRAKALRQATMGPEELREAERAMERNRLIFWETRQQRELRLLRERVEIAENGLKEAAQKALTAQK